MTVCSKRILFDMSSRLASNDTINSVLRYREVGRAKDLSASRSLSSFSSTGSVFNTSRFLKSVYMNVTLAYANVFDFILR